jgi:hypothetical protein
MPMVGTLGNLAAIYSYSKTKGIFAGVSLEGSVIIERKDANSKFYNRKIGAKEILSGTIPRPAAATELYRALDFRSGSNSNAAVLTSPVSPTGGNAVSPPPYSYSTQYSATSANSNGSAAKSMSGGMTTSAVPARPPVPPRLTTSAREPTAVAIYDFVAQRPDDLSFHKGDIIVISKKTDSQNDWWSGM